MINNCIPDLYQHTCSLFQFLFHRAATGNNGGGEGRASKQTAKDSASSATKKTSKKKKSKASKKKRPRNKGPKIDPEFLADINEVRGNHERYLPLCLYI